MKRKGGIFFFNLIVLCVGILFIAASKQDDFISSLIYFIGVLFIIPGAVNIISLINDRDAAPEERKHNGTRRVVTWATACAAVILGLTMCVFPSVFHKPVIFILGGVIIIMALYHFFLMARGLRPVVFPVWAFILPLVLLGGGIWLLVGDFKATTTHDTVILIAGISFVVFALTSVIEGIIFKAGMHKINALAKSQGQSAPTSAAGLGAPTQPANTDHQLKQNN